MGWTIDHRSNLGRQLTLAAKTRQKLVSIRYGGTHSRFLEGEIWEAFLLKATSQPTLAHFLPIHGPNRWVGAHSPGDHPVKRLGKIQLKNKTSFPRVIFYHNLLLSLGLHGYTNTSTGTFVTAMWRRVGRMETPAEDHWSQHCCRKRNLIRLCSEISQTFPSEQVGLQKFQSPHSLQ